MKGLAKPQHHGTREASSLGSDMRRTIAIGA